MDKQTRKIVSFFELSPEWQKEAKSNLDDIAEESYYLEPLEEHNPVKHILWDLTECMPIKNQEYNAVIRISNNSAMALLIDDTFESAVIWFL